MSRPLYRPLNRPLWGLVLLLALIGLPRQARSAEGGPRIEDRRTHEVIKRDCRSSLGRGEITLFANGTLRHRFGPLDEVEMTLLELTQPEVDAYINRLVEEDLSETDRRSANAGGDWIDECVVTLRLPGHQDQIFSYGPFDSLSLALSRVVSLVDELEGKAREESSRSRLPIGYIPKGGDVLQRFDGFLYRVVGFTKLKRGIELEGIDQPLVLFVALDELHREFVELISRRRRYR